MAQLASLSPVEENLLAEAQHSITQVAIWFNRNVGLDQCLYIAQKTNPAQQRQTLDTAHRLAFEAVTATTLAVYAVKNDASTSPFVKHYFSTSRKLSAKLSHMIEIYRRSVKSDDVYISEIAKEFNTTLSILDFASCTYVSSVRRGVSPETLLALGGRLGPSTLHIWGDALQSYAETSLRRHKEAYITGLNLAEERYTLALSLQPSLHQARYGLGNVLLLKAKATPNEQHGVAALTRAREAYEGAIKDFNLTNDYVYRLARVNALLRDEAGCMKALRRYIYDLGGRTPAAHMPEEAMLSHPDFVIYREKEWFYALLEYMKALRQQDGAPKAASSSAEGHGLNMLTSSLLQDGFAMKILSEMLAWTPAANGSKSLSDTFVQFPKEEENEYVKLQKARLQERIQLYGLVPSRDIPGDGNCQMYAISDQLFGTIDRGAEIRAAAVAWLRKNRECKLDNGALLHHFVHDRPWEEYCDYMAKDKTWGDHLTLMAVSEAFGIVILIISSVEGDNYITEIRPSGQGEGCGEGDPTGRCKGKMALLSHYAEFHYGSLTHAKDT
eukprot:TRINITY_DN798_c0_g1_i3.p1 TRINITY_DN798_c0_g1~~TRINITY_DN798_c0_g1_i3.p1  ORF type:complete len:555 (-),score=150.10 TRINITY_DN798_c0_g1_i3:132-1796(-)